MDYSFRYDLTEIEKRLVRVLVERGLAKYGVSCCVEATELTAAVGDGEVPIADLASAMETLAGRVVNESRGSEHTSLRIFESMLAQGVYPHSARWTYKFSRQFLQFRIGRNL